MVEIPFSSHQQTLLSEGTFWKFLHTTESCQNSSYLTPWLLYAYIYAQSEKAFNSQCKHSTVLRHVFFKKWTITPLKKLPLANFDRVPLCIQVSDLLTVNSLSKGNTSPTRRSLPRMNRTGRCCRGLCQSQAPPCQNCMKKSPLANFDRVPLCIQVSDPLVNSLSKGTPPLPDTVYREQIGLADAAGDSAKVGHPLPKLHEKNRPWPTLMESRSVSKWAILSQSTHYWRGTPPLPDTVYHEWIGLVNAAGDSAKVGHPLPKLHV